MRRSFCTILHFFTLCGISNLFLMGHDLTSIDVPCALISLNLLVLYVIACCVKSDM